MDEDLSRRADVVFVASDRLLTRKRALSRHVAVSPHGVDVEHFRRAADASLPLPPEMAVLSGVVIGFYGLIEAWIDLGLVKALAERHPEWTFVMIGRVAVTEVPQLPNVHFIGRRPYEELPDYGRRFDVSIVPYHLTQQVHFANPIKLREYLAMEKPIVAVPTPEIDKFGDLVHIATTVDEWDAAIRDALAVTDRTAEAAAMRAAAAAMTWDARLLRVEGIVADALAGRPFDPPPVAR
jgi:glycosyltransferase involved in cell wall biosynthesis